MSSTSAASVPTNATSPMRLEDGCRVAVIGGGPAGSLFSFFFLETASRDGLEATVDVYEPKTFDRPGPAGCNMCGGIISESLVQLLSTEGINLPPTVIQRGIDSYVLHMDVGSVGIEQPGQEKRIGAVHRGAGPRGLEHKIWEGFDGHLQRLAAEKGANIIPERVESVSWENGRPRLMTKPGLSEPYDLLVVATGVNGYSQKLHEQLGVKYEGPRTTKTAISEFYLGEGLVNAYLGSSMHVFLLNLPRLEFAALIPKGEYITMALLGEDVDKELVMSFLNSPEVRECLPPDWELPADYCRCFPSINVRGATQPFGDRLVFIGDCGESRLYKDGIGGAYRTAKAASKTAVFEGVSAQDFRRHYLPVCRTLATDNSIGGLIFWTTNLIQSAPFSRRGILRMVEREQKSGRNQRMSGVLWDTFTGSAPYRDILVRTLHPMFLWRLVSDTVASLFVKKTTLAAREEKVRLGELGKIYRPGEAIVRQGEVGDCMYVIQSGSVEVVRESDGKEVRLAELSDGDFFGEMALFEKDVRSATVRPLNEVRVLTIDKKIFLRKIHEDPSLAFRIMQKMSQRIREIDGELARLGPVASVGD